MKRPILSLLLLFSFIPAVRAADEIILKSGKTLTGRISSETAESYTLRLSGNMYLSIAKEEVARVKREKKPGPAVRPAVQSEMTPVAASTPAAAGKPPAAAPRSGAAPAVAADPNAPAAPETITVGVAKLQKLTQYRTYPVDGKTFGEAQSHILDAAKGKGFLNGRQRSPSKTEWNAAWTGTPGKGGQKWSSMVVTATVTVSFPAWTAPPGASAADAEAWAAFLQKATEHETAHLGIIQDALLSFGQAVSNVTATKEADLRSETTALFKAIQDQTKKRRQGYDRRESRPANQLKKK